MVKRCMNLMVVLLVWSMSHVNAADPLTQKQQDAIVSWIGAAPADRPAADSLGLPTDMTADGAAEMLQTIWGVYRDKTFASAKKGEGGL